MTATRPFSQIAISEVSKIGMAKSLRVKNLKFVSSIYRASADTNCKVIMRSFKVRCPYCTQTYIYSGAFESHIRRKHPGLPATLPTLNQHQDPFGQPQPDTSQRHSDRDEQRLDIDITGEILGAPASPTYEDINENDINMDFGSIANTDDLPEDHTTGDNPPTMETFPAAGKLIEDDIIPWSSPPKGFNPWSPFNSVYDFKMAC